MILWFLIAESVGNIGFSAGVDQPWPDSTTMIAVGTDARAGASLDIATFVNNTLWDPGWLALSWGISLGFKYHNFQGSLGRADFYTVPTMLHGSAFFPGDRIRAGLDMGGGLCYQWTRWDPPLNDGVSSIRPLAWAGEIGGFAGLRLSRFLWVQASYGLWATNGPVLRDLFEPGTEGTVDLVVKGRFLRLNLLFGN